MGVYQTKEFSRFARKAALADQGLIEAARSVAERKSDADLGGGVYKQRVARAGGGKSGGFRTIILFKAGRHSFFVYGFAKNDKANVTIKELRALKALATTLLALSDDALAQAVAAGEVSEIRDDGEDRDKI